MNIKRYFDAKEFYNAVFDVLVKHEVQNSLPLGIVALGNKGGEERGWKNVKNWYMATVLGDNGEIALVAVMTPPMNITLYEADNVPNEQALNCLCENILKEEVTVAGVTAKDDLADRFAQIYCARTSISFKTHMNLRLYTLEKVEENVPQRGTLRRAEQKDLYFLPYWYSDFYIECELGKESFENIVATVNSAIESKMLFILEEEGMPLSMAAATRETVNGRRVAMVYTPPHFRKKGYASCCTAKVSQIILDSGYKYAALFADLKNPVSNSIYQKIGYRPVCDYKEIQFNPAEK